MFRCCASKYGQSPRFRINGYPMMCLAAIVSLTIPLVAHGAILGVSYSNPSPAHGMTFMIDESTGTGASVGPSNINFLNSLARDKNNVFWSAGMPNGDLRNHLISIDPVTGAGSVGPLLNFGAYDTYISALAISPSNVLYGMATNDYLFTIDTQTGMGTFVGQVDHYQIGIQAMAFAPDGTLYGWGVMNYGLITINPATGAFTDVNPSVGASDIQGMTFGPDGTLYGVRDSLYRIDKTTGITTRISSGGGFADVRGIAFMPVPEPSTLALLGIGALGLPGYAWRRRRLAARDILSIG
jgi:hypothetical protein